MMLMTCCRRGVGLIWRGLLTRKGPCSVRKPSKELQPGPPLSHSTSGSVAGLFCDSTNLEEVSQVNQLSLESGESSEPGKSGELGKSGKSAESAKPGEPVEQHEPNKSVE